MLPQPPVHLCRPAGRWRLGQACPRLLGLATIAMTLDTYSRYLSSMRGRTRVVQGNWYPRRVKKWLRSAILLPYGLDPKVPIPTKRPEPRRTPSIGHLAIYRQRCLSTRSLNSACVEESLFRRWSYINHVAVEAQRNLIMA